MASELAAYYVSIVPSAKGLAGKIGREFAGIDGEADKAGKSSGKSFSNAFKGSMAGIAGAFAAVGVGSFVKDAVQGAGDLEQSVGAIESVFKGSSKDMKQWSRTAATNVGLTSNEFNELGTLIGSQLKNGGTAMEDLAPKTKDLIGLGADLSSMFGGSTKDAVDALSSALKGERDPIEKYGVSLNQAKIDAEAAALGFEKVGGALSAEATQAATMSLIMKQTGDAHGNFAKESDTFAHKQQVMAAQWGDLTTKVGELFLPTFTGLIGFFTDKAMPVIGEVVGGVRAFSEAFKAADGDITSNGFPGFMERVGDAARGVYDLFTKGDYTGALYRAFKWEEDSPVVDKILTVRDTILKVPDAIAKIADKLWEQREPIGVIVGLITLTLIPHWVALATEALKSAAKQKLAWMIARTAAVKAAFVHSAAVTAMIAGWVLLGAQATINAVKTAAAWLIALGPIGWVIGAIAALVAGFVWAYHNIDWFRAGVDAAMKWVGEAVANAFEWVQDSISAVADWFTGTLVPAWENAVKSVGNFFKWLHDGIIKPVFDGIAGIFKWFHDVVVKPVFAAISAAVGSVIAVFQGIYNFLKPAFDSIGVILNGFWMLFDYIFKIIVAVIQQIVIPLFMAFWTRTVEAFNAIGTAISGWWAGVSSTFNDVVSFVRTVLSAAFTWFVNSVIRPVWNTVSSIVRGAWTTVSGIFNAVVNFIRAGLSTAFTWFRDSVVKPVFDGISNIVRFWWNNIVMPVFNAVRGFVQNTLAPIFPWLHRTIIKPAFDGIGSAIKWVWDHVIKPVFDTLSNFITKTIPKAFEDGVKFIKTAWDKLQEIAKAPVRFVIDTVINKGLIDGLNNIGGFLGLDKLPHVGMPAGFANGGYTGDGGKYQPAGIVHAGEYVFTKEQTRRAGVGNLAALAGSLTGYAKGGIVNPLKQMALTQGYNRVHKGIDLAAAVGTPVYATQNGVVTHSGPGASAPGVWGGQEIHVLGNGIETWFAHLSQLGVKLGQNVRAGQQIGLSGNTGISSGPHLHFGTFAGGWPNDINPLSYLGGAGIPSGKPWNPIGDIVGGLVDSFKKQFPAAGFIADLAIGAGKKILDGAVKFVTGQSGKDGNATGPTVYDGGGWLRNTGGAQLVQHNKRKPDAVLSHEQWSTMSRIAENSATTGPRVEFSGPIHVRDENELARIITTRQMDALAVYV
jgi:hypothetical protein